MHHPVLARRSFLARNLTAALGACALGPVTSWRLFSGAPPRSSRTKVRFGFTTYQWGKDWDVPALIANLQKAEVWGVELRTSQSYAHGVELRLNATRRQEVKKQFADSPITLVGLASGERMDWPEAARLRQAIEAAKGYLKLSHDVGGSGVRIFPNQFHKGVPREQTIAQIAKAADTLGAYADAYGQEVRLEAHGAAGELPTLRAIMDQVTHPRVRLKLNSDARDARGRGFEQNFNLVKDFLGHTLHLHNLKNSTFPYQLQTDLLVKMGWDGWALLEASDKVPDRLAALIEQRQIWDDMIATSLQA